MTQLKTQGLFIGDFRIVRRLIPLGGLKAWAYFHLRPAPTEKAEVRETACGLKEVKQTVRRHQESSNAAMLELCVCVVLGFMCVSL